MESFKTFLKQAILPTSKDLKELASLNASFAARTRHIETKKTEFIQTSESSNTSTWAFTSIEREYPELQKSCDLLSMQLGKRVQCNAYWTPAHHQGLPAHYDLHDVYVFQVEGSKQWRTWKPFRRSVSVETLLSDEKENLPNWTKMVIPKAFILNAGENFYLTAGEPHECFATAEPSLHFSFGIYND